MREPRPVVFRPPQSEEALRRRAATAAERAATRQAAAHERLLAAVGKTDGIARATTLQKAGHTRRTITAAVRAGILNRVRRAWVALPTADALLVTAAGAGAVISCLTQAQRIGLWVLRDEGLHLAKHPHARSDAPDSACVHWSVPIVPRHPDDLVDPIENVLDIVARCQPHDAALVIWESALRLGLVARDHLTRLPLSAEALALLAEAMPYADSGLETIFYSRLRWLNVRITAQVCLHGKPVDFLIGDRLVVQIDGGHHVGAQRTRDVAHDAALMAAGYHVIRFTYAQIVDDWAAVHAVIARAIAHGLHEAA